jgi:predicted lactoylglutathione lyase
VRGVELARDLAERLAARSVLCELARARRADVSAMLAAADATGAWGAQPAEREAT